MILFPYKKQHYFTDLSPEEIRNKIEKNVVKSEWKITLDDIVSNHVLEGKINKKGFIIVMGKYGLTYGRTSLLPYLTGKIKKDSSSGSRLDIIIRASNWSGFAILSIVYIIALFAIYLSWTKKEVAGILVGSFLIGLTYISILLKFNKERKAYIQFIEKEILQQ